MFDNNTSTNVTNNVSTNNHQSIKINACSGGIYKTYKESWFEQFNLKSKKADKLLNGYEVKSATSVDKDWDGKNIISYNDENVVVLQMIICGDMEVIVELIREEDFNYYFMGTNEIVEEKNIEIIKLKSEVDDLKRELEKEKNL